MELKQQNANKSHYLWKHRLPMETRHCSPNRLHCLFLETRHVSPTKTRRWLVLESKSSLSIPIYIYIYTSSYQTSDLARLS